MHLQPLNNTRHLLGPVTSNDIGVESTVNDDRYPIINPKKFGHFVIFNQTFKRAGTEHDVKRLIECAGKYGFLVQSFDDMTSEKFLETIDKCSKTATEHSVFAVCILAHGFIDNTVQVYDRNLNVNEVRQKMASCEGLYGKPKILIVQSYRGNEYRDTIPFPESPKTETDGTNYRYETDGVNVPAAADFILFWATVKGFVSYGLPKKGGIFIQALCQCMDEYGEKEDILQIFTRVNNKVSQNELAQMLQLKSTLRKSLYLPIPKGNKRILNEDTDEDTKEDNDPNFKNLPIIRKIPNFEDMYPIINPNKLGHFIIFNRTINRFGTKNDVKLLKESFTTFGFLVQSFDNFTSTNILETIDKCSKTAAEHSVFAVSFLLMGSWIIQLKLLMEKLMCSISGRKWRVLKISMGNPKF
ncbi:caspase-7-like [Arctopsyche grandis]|uniref:caspase-7-like n=1 Tax=Arctopsyche grandis TaxID=121162 RepID=UPI00406D945C